MSAETCDRCGVCWSEHGAIIAEECYRHRAHDRIAELAKEVARLTALLGAIEDCQDDPPRDGLGVSVSAVLKQWRGR